MLAVLIVVLLVAAFGCFLLAAVGVTARVQLQPLGLACWVLTAILSSALTDVVKIAIVCICFLALLVLILRPRPASA